jgi:hypothetical protein
VLLSLRVGRLFCDNVACGRRTFAEPLPGLAARHARRTSMLNRVLSAVASRPVRPNANAQVLRTNIAALNNRHPSAFGGQPLILDRRGRGRGG